MAGGMLRVSGSMINWGYGVRGLDWCCLGLMAGYATENHFLLRLLAYQLSCIPDWKRNKNAWQMMSCGKRNYEGSTG